MSTMQSNEDLREYSAEEWKPIILDHINRKSATAQARRQVQNAPSAENLFILVQNCSETEEEQVLSMIRILVQTNESNLQHLLMPLKMQVPTRNILLLLSKLRFLKNADFAHFLLTWMMEIVFVPSATAEMRKYMLQTVLKSTSCVSDAQLVQHLLIQLDKLIFTFDDVVEYVLCIYDDVLDESHEGAFFQNEWLNYMIKWFPLVNVANMTHFVNAVYASMERDQINNTTPQLEAIQSILFNATIQSRDLFNKIANFWESMFDLGITVPWEMVNVLVDKSFEFGIANAPQVEDDLQNDSGRQGESAYMIASIVTAHSNYPKLLPKVEEHFYQSLERLCNHKEFQLVCTIADKIPTVNAEIIAGLLLQKVTSTYCNEHNAIRYEEAVILLIKRVGLPKNKDLITQYMNMTLRVFNSLKRLKYEI